MSEKITITFPDGNKKEVDKGISGLELASQISKSLAKESVAVKINDEINKSINSVNQKDLSLLNNKKGKLMDLRMELTGTISLNYADVFSGSPPSVQRRLGSMSWELYNTTSKQTKTHENTLNISIKKYEDILDRFKKL